MSKKQEDDKKTVFDGGTFGIGHNQGPPLDDREVIAAEADANADTDTRLVKRGRKRRRVSGSKLTPEALVWLRAKEKSGELEKVTWDSPYGSDVVENFERRRAGPSKHGGSGKWRNPDGLVSRRGYRRVSPLDSQEEAWLKEYRIDVIRETATRILYGPHATIFEKYYFGEPRRSTVEELAAQFGKLDKRIYKILEKCRQKIIRAIRGEPEPPKPERKAKVRYAWVREYTDAKWGGLIYEDNDGRRYIEYLRESIAGDAGVRPTDAPKFYCPVPLPPEPDEKWKSMENDRLENIRDQIELQRARKKEI
jgi:hypothetical protein